MDATEATMAVREYFESIKKIKFIFEVRNVTYENEEDEDEWIVECDIQNLFDDETISYKIGVSNETGEILYVEEIED